MAGKILKAFIAVMAVVFVLAICATFYVINLQKADCENIGARIVHHENGVTVCRFPKAYKE